MAAFEYLCKTPEARVDPFLCQSLYFRRKISPVASARLATLSCKEDSHTSITSPGTLTSEEDDRTHRPRSGPTCPYEFLLKFIYDFCHTGFSRFLRRWRSVNEVLFNR